PVATPDQWLQQRRPELLKLFAEQVYGKAPPGPDNLKFQILSQDANALGGKAIRKEIEVTLAEGPEPVKMTMLLYVPKNARPAPVFWGLNFAGNHSITDDPAVRLNPNWIADRYPGVENNKASEASRGSAAKRW